MQDELYENRVYATMALVNLIKADAVARHFLMMKGGFKALQEVQAIKVFPYASSRTPARP